MSYNLHVTRMYLILSHLHRGIGHSQVLHMLAQECRAFGMSQLWRRSSLADLIQSDLFLEP